MTLHPWEREKVIRDINLENRFAKLESRFRNILQEKGVYSQSSLPVRHSIEAIEQLAHSLDTEVKVEQKQPVAQVVSKQCFSQGMLEKIELTEQDVFNRSSISNLGEQVLANINLDTDQPK